MAVADETTRVPYTVYGTRRRPWVRHAAILGSAVAALLVLGLGANAWMTRDVIQPGVSVGGVDVGGMSRSEARDLLARQIGDKLGRPVQVRTAAGTVPIVPSASGIGVDLDRAVDEAMSTGRLEARLLRILWSTEIAAPLRFSSTSFLPEQLASLQSEPRDARLVVRVRRLGTRDRRAPGTSSTRPRPCVRSASRRSPDTPRSTCRSGSGRPTSPPPRPGLHC